MAEWWAVTYRGTAEMVVWVKADSVKAAKKAAEEGDYDDASQVEFVRGKPYTMRANPAPYFTPGDPDV